MKYLIVERGTKTEAILFGACLGHDDMKRALEPGFKVVGAGICSFNWNPDECGWDVHLVKGSTSLNMKAKEDDKFFIRFALNFR